MKKKLENVWKEPVVYKGGAIATFIGEPGENHEKSPSV
jgi:hypothetical protein